MDGWSDQTKKQYQQLFLGFLVCRSIRSSPAWIFDFESADNYDYNYQYDGGADVRETYMIFDFSEYFQGKKGR